MWKISKLCEHLKLFSLIFPHASLIFHQRYVNFRTLLANDDFMIKPLFYNLIVDLTLCENDNINTKILNYIKRNFHREVKNKTSPYCIHQSETTESESIFRLNIIPSIFSSLCLSRENVDNSQRFSPA